MRGTPAVCFSLSGPLPIAPRCRESLASKPGGFVGGEEDGDACDVVRLPDATGRADMLCSAAHDASPLNGMVWMYVLMSAFHSAPWLKLISSRRNGAR